MLFNTGLVTFLVASIAMASPISRSPLTYGTSTLIDRDDTLCKTHVPCFVQGQVNIAVDAINASYANDITPVDAIVADLTACANTLAQVAADLPGYISATSAADQVTLIADINAAITVGMTTINDGTGIVLSVNSSPPVVTAVAAVKTAMAGIVAVVGSCF